MAISNYTELQAAIADWMARSDVSGSAADFITLGEARLNRLLDPVATTAPLTGTIGSKTIDISSLSVQEPQNLYVTSGEEEFYLTPRALGTYSISTVAGLPSIWAIENQTITLDRELDEAYSFRFVYLGRFALSDAAPTNEFLTNNPDLYMASSIVWGSVYTKDLPQAAMWKQMLDEFTAEVAHENSRKKRSQLTVDPALGVIGRLRYSIGRDSEA
ncbi:hypothetical protein FA04_14560 [Ensifer adhaerens]|uniref:Uncharacterized protein n=1 Tax=Ensifer adhaerens TaxID=106592 RepID=A0ABY8HCY7_ENSAD|nr:hypothetical protein [Ensifer adhaerens]ANK73734.1 hypothetical protein FA04_14560 [Ensifer adhaerens]KDP70304.1 hypothetical protein FA04_29150 [Ensifer adhaerens]WFP89818.1 hypothetical protein P4B07_14790 [Ensifer adhaerens]